MEANACRLKLQEEPFDLINDIDTEREFDYSA